MCFFILRCSKQIKLERKRIRLRKSLKYPGRAIEFMHKYLKPIFIFFAFEMGNITLAEKSKSPYPHTHPFRVSIGNYIRHIWYFWITLWIMATAQLCSHFTVKAFFCRKNLSFFPFNPLKEGKFILIDINAYDVSKASSDTDWCIMKFTNRDFPPNISANTYIFNINVGAHETWSFHMFQCEVMHSIAKARYQRP